MTRAFARVRLLLIAASSVVALVACDQSPAGPSRTPDPRSAGPVLPQIRLTGLVVDGDGRPVPGALIAAPSGGGGAAPEAVAGAAGAYTLTVDRQDGLAVVEVRKDGFEPSRLYVSLGSSGAAEVKRNLRLHEILRISVDESIDLSIEEDDPVCDNGLEEWWCRRVRILSPIRGHLIVVASVDGSAAHLIRLQLPGQLEPAPDTLRIPVGAGSETIVEVLRVGPSPPLTLGAFLGPS